MKRIRRKWRRALPVILFFCVAMTLAMGIYTYRYEPERYRATYTLYAVPSGGDPENDASRLAEMLCRDCDLLANTPEFQARVLSRAESDGDTRVFVRQADGAHMLRVVAVGTDGRVVAGLANAVGEALLQELEGPMGAAHVHEVSRAEEPAEPFMPRRPVRLALTFCLSFLLLSLLGILLESSWEPVCWNPGRAPETCPPCLGGVVEYDACLQRREKKRRRGKPQPALYDDVDELTRETVRDALLRLRGLQERPGCSLVMAGATTEESASIALLTGSELARQGFEVLMVEMDPYRHELRDLLGVRGTMDVQDCLQREDALRTALLSTPVERMCFIDVCHQPGFLQQIVATEAFASFLSDAAHTFDYVILSAPDCQTCGDAAALGAVADMTLLIAQDGRYSQKELEGLTDALRGQTRRVGGVILCRVPFRRFSKKKNAYSSAKA